MLRSEPQQKHNQAVPKKGPFFCRKQASQTWALVMEIHVCAHRIKPERIATVPVCMCEGFEIALGSHVFIHANLIAHGGVG